jgi:hypothetical protein
MKEDTKKYWGELKQMMGEELSQYLINAHTKPNEVKKDRKGRYFLLDRNIIWIPSYLYNITEYRRYKLHGII